MSPLMSSDPEPLQTDDPDLFLEQYKPPLTIDEIHYAPVLMRRIKVLVDRSKKNGQYWLTGSQHFTLMHGVSESLAGRIAIIKLLGLSQHEEYRKDYSDEPFRPDKKLASHIKKIHTLGAAFRRIVRGTFPRFIQKDVPPVQTFHGSYLQTYIERDVRTLTRVTNLAEFEKFLRLAAARTGQLLNLSDLARDTGVAVSTAKEWLGIVRGKFSGLPAQTVLPQYQ